MTRATGRRTPAQCAGAAAEDFAERLLARHGLQVLARNYRTRFGEIDLIAREGDTLVFVEVRMRADGRFGGADGSVTRAKRSRIEAAARHYLSRLGREPACRFDVVSLEGGEPRWLRAAFEG